MNIPLDGYRTTRLLRTSRSTQVYAAVREHDQRAVVAKVYELSADEGLEARVEHEFRLIHGLEVEGVVRALALERTGSRLALVLDWCEGVNLEEYCGGRALPISEFLAIALQISRALADIHGQRVIHRDIKPTNLLIDPQTKQVSIADFGISVLLENERERINDPEVVEGTLPYVSPEQTGRTHREVDFRSDLYSLGVTFYELLTGRRPFEARSPLELIHAHLARRPEPPQWLRPEIPTPLSAIVMKLLEKAPERRYQSARGLHRDLDRLADALAEGRELDDFELGGEDVPATLQLPHRLYGRKREVETLLAEFRRAVRGEPRCVAIVGAGGVGKSALIDQLAEPVMSRRGYLARGKFDPEQRDKPYAGFISVFSDLADQLLTESDKQLGHWQRELQRELGPLRAALVDVVPKLRSILGPAPSVPELGPVEAHNRLALACARLIAVFARAEHPLVIALDDVHWADRGSCELIASCLDEPGAALLFIATLRDDELGPDHPLRELRDLIDRERGQLRTIELGPLPRAEVEALVADALAQAPERVQPLAELVGRKTNDNPFFVRQFLVHLVELELLHPSSEGWVWDAQAIEAAGIPEDLLAMMTAKLARLGPVERELLVSAAVVGTRFDVGTLEALIGPETVAAGLVPLIDEGLIAPLGGGRHSFTHDRIREVAYHMAGPARRIELHRAIAEIRLGRVGVGELNDSIFELVDHLNLGYGLLPLVDEAPEAAAARADKAVAELDDFMRSHIAELNALAGYKTLNGSATASAVGYLEAGVRLISYGREFPAPGEAGHTLRFALELGLCQALALAGERARAEAQFEALLDQPLDFGDVGRAVSKRIELRVLDGDEAGAVDAAIRGLRRLGFALPRSPSKVEVARSLAKLTPKLRLSELRKLGERPRVRDPRIKAGLEIFNAASTVAYFAGPGFHVVLACAHMQTIVEHGRHPTGAVALSQIANIISGGLGWHRMAIELADIARSLAEQEGPACPRHRVDPTYWYIATWARPYADALASLRSSTERALEAGDLEYAGYVTAMHAMTSLAAGVHLRSIERISEVAVHRLRQWGAGKLVDPVEAYRDFARVLLAGDEQALSRDLGPFRARAERRFEHTRELLHAMLLYLFGRHRRALAVLESVAGGEDSRMSSWETSMRSLLSGLSAAALVPKARRLERYRLLRSLERELERMRGWAKLGPQNFEPGAALLAAELTAIRGSIIEALEGFAGARRRAASSRTPMIEAIACERMAELADAHGLGELAYGPMREAVARYRHWGAFTKVAELERRWPDLLGEHHLAPEHHGELTRTGATSSSTTSRALDMATILKTSQAIAEDIRLEEVVDRVMAIAVENAGAERGALFLPGDKGLELSALCSAEGPNSGFIREPVPIESAGERVPVSLLHWVERTREPAILDDATVDTRFCADPYVERERVRSVLCLPIVKHSRLIGLIYLENKLSPGSFTGERLEVIRLLMAQAASALENAQLYEALRASEVRWRSLVEGLPDVVMLVDRQGRIEFVNHLEQGEGSGTLGQAAGRFVDAEHRATIRDALNEVVEHGEQREVELRATLPGRAPAWYSVRLAPIVVDGRVERVISVGTDITERREAADAKVRLEAQLRQQQRLESIGTLASGVAHEINNPVQGIMNYAELISMSSSIDEDAREFAFEIQHESQRVASIVRNLLAFSRQEGEFGVIAVEVQEIVEGTLSLIRTVLRKDQITLEVDIPEDLPNVECRPQQIQQVIMNLVTNARDALTARYAEFDENKRIDIRASTFEREGEQWVRFSVSDRGGGVPEKVVARIFDPFFTTKGRDRGTGLGLAVSHGIITEHGGELHLDNHIGVGACFRIELPRRSPATRAREASEAS